MAVDPSVGSILTHSDPVFKPVSSHSSPAVASTKGLFQDQMCVEEKACVKGKPQGLREVVLSQPLLSPRAAVANRRTGRPKGWRRLTEGTHTPHSGQWAQGEWNQTGVFCRQLLLIQFCYHFCTNSHVHILLPTAPFSLSQLHFPTRAIIIELQVVIITSKISRATV